MVNYMAQGIGQLNNNTGGLPSGIGSTSTPEQPTYDWDKDKAAKKWDELVVSGKYSPEEFFKNIESQGLSVEGNDIAKRDFVINNKSEEKKSFEDKSAITRGLSNITLGVGASTKGAGKALGTAASWAVGGVAKLLGADEEKVDSLVESYRDSWSTREDLDEQAANPDSMLFKGAKMVADLAQTASAAGAINKGAKATQLGKGAINLSDDFAKGATKMLTNLKMKPELATKAVNLAGKALKGGAAGVEDMLLYKGIADQEIASKGDMALGAGIGVGAPLAGAGIAALWKPVYDKLINVVGKSTKTALEGIETSKVTKIIEQAKNNAEGVVDDAGKKIVSPVTTLADDMYKDVKTIIDPMRKEVGENIGRLKEGLGKNVIRDSVSKLDDKLNISLKKNGLKVVNDKIIPINKKTVTFTEDIIAPAQKIQKQMKILKANPTFEQFSKVKKLITDQTNRISKKGGDASIFKTIEGLVGEEYSKMISTPLKTSNKKYKELIELIDDVEKGGGVDKPMTFFKKIEGGNKDTLIKTLEQIDGLTNKNYLGEGQVAVWMQNAANQVNIPGGAELFRPSLGGVVKGATEGVLGIFKKPFKQALKKTKGYVPKVSKTKGALGGISSNTAKGVKLEGIDLLGGDNN